MDSLPEVNSFVFNDVPTIARYDVDGTPVIANIWPYAITQLHNWSVLVVLTGNGNDRYTSMGDSCDYKYVISISWVGDHSKPVQWFTNYLLFLRQVIRDAVPSNQAEVVDILGLSRGHVALMACCEYREDNEHLDIGNAFRYFMAAGGCIWQATDETVAFRIFERHLTNGRCSWIKDFICNDYSGTDG